MHQNTISCGNHVSITQDVDTVLRLWYNINRTENKRDGTRSFLGADWQKNRGFHPAADLPTMQSERVQARDLISKST